MEGNPFVAPQFSQKCITSCLVCEVVVRSCLWEDPWKTWVVGTSLTLYARLLGYRLILPC
jgi:hypothetical protein